MLSDNDIDKLFKQAAAKQQPQFDAADWNDMAKRLEQSEQRPSYFNWISTVVLLGSVVWLSWMTLDADQQMKRVERLSQTEQEAPMINAEVLNDSNVHDVDQQEKALVLDKDAMQADKTSKKDHVITEEENSTALTRDEAHLAGPPPAKTKTENSAKNTSSVNQADKAVRVEMNSARDNRTTDQAGAVHAETNGTRKNSAVDRKTTDQVVAETKLSTSESVQKNSNDKLVDDKSKQAANTKTTDLNNGKSAQVVAEMNPSTSESVQKNSNDKLVDDKSKQAANTKTTDPNNGKSTQVVAEMNPSTSESVQKNSNDKLVDDKSKQVTYAKTTEAAVISSALATTTNVDGQKLIGTNKNTSTNSNDVLMEQNQRTTSSTKGRANAVAQNKNSIDSLAPIKKDDKEDEKVLVKETEKPADSLNRKSWFHGLAIKATVSPDFSGDQFKSIEKTGFNYGLMLEYFIHDKFSVSSGAIWSRKYYSAQDVAYGYYQADEVYGDCRMWDIPLNFTYYNSPSKPYSFFFSVGASSYLMKEENYSYKIETAYGTVSYDEQVLKENNEWFKMLNLSIGVQKKLHERWAFQVEPFIKVPLAGVGKGNIQLSSFGSFFSIRYKILDP